MLAYNIKLAFLSIRHRKGLALLLVLLIAIGVSAVMTMFTVIHNMGADPMPRKSERLFAVQLDNQEVGQRKPVDQNDVPERVTFRDAQHFLTNKSTALNVVALYSTQVTLVNEQGDARPYGREAIATNAAFFSAFDVPFQYGGPWSDAIDAAGTPAIVIDKQLNDRLFGGADSTGKSIDLGSVSATIVGVIGDWAPNTRFYDSSMNPTYLHQAFLPLNFAFAANLPRDDNPMNCWERDSGNRKGYLKTDLDGLKASECTFLNLWAELPSAAAQRDYAAFVDRYIDDQRSFGRFPRPTLSFVTDLKEWMVVNRAVRPQFKVFLVVAVLLLLICLTNMVSLILAKLMGKTKEVCIRRALGADIPTLFAQNLIEVGIVAIAGGIAALLLAQAGLLGMRSLMTLAIGAASPTFNQVFEIDWRLALVALGIAVSSALIASAYPIWSVCRSSPAFNLKGD